MADNDTPTDDLRSILSQSFDESVTPADDAGKAAAPKVDVDAAADKSATTDADAKDADRERGPDGKFVKKTEAEEKADAKVASDDKEKPEAKTETKSDEKPDDKASQAKTSGKEPPERWTPSDKAMFKLQPPEVQEFLLRRHSAMEADYTKKVESVADLRKEFEPIQQMFAPHLDVLKAKGLTPASTIKAWANVETALANGRGVDIVKGMVDSYGIDKAAVARALGFTSGTAAAQSTDATKAATDPAATAHQPIALPPELTQELQQLRARLDAQDNERRSATQRSQQQKLDQVETEIQTFKSAANEKGELLHPYYDEVEPAMIALAQSYAASKQPLPKIADLYDTAVWANPSTRAAVLASQKAVDQAKANEEARAKAASARKAGSSVTGAPSSGQTSRPIKGEVSLREGLEDAYADVAGR
jgi:hypothetical protein